MHIVLQSKLPFLMDLQFKEKGTYPQLETFLYQLDSSDEMVILNHKNIEKINHFFNDEQKIRGICSELVDYLGLSSLATSEHLYLLDYIIGSHDSRYIHGISTFQHITITDKRLIGFLKESRKNFFDYVKQSDKNGLLSNYCLNYEEEIKLIEIYNYSKSVSFKFCLDYLLEGIDPNHFKHYQKDFFYDANISKNQMRINVLTSYTFDKENNNE